MPIEAVGNPPPEADQLRAELESKLPEIIASFSQVLQEQFGLTGIRVAGFSVVPESAIPAGVSCDEESCSID